jgi:hypothetical protein
MSECINVTAKFCHRCLSRWTLPLQMSGKFNMMNGTKSVMYDVHSLNRQIYSITARFAAFCVLYVLLQKVWT